MLNIFMLNNFFGKSDIFWGNCKKLFWGAFDHFLVKGILRQKINTQGVPKLQSSASLRACNAIYQEIKYVVQKYNIFT